jgi:molybdopterin converting factor small subunit
MAIIRMKLFASARDIAGGRGEITLEFTEGATITVSDLKERALQTYPKLAQIPFVFAINYKIVSKLEAIAITPYDEIALLPPINGG